MRFLKRGNATINRMERIDTGERERRQLHDRWVTRRNRDMSSDTYRDEWYPEQCLHCRYYIPLEHPMGLDFGACANAASHVDQRVMFEHDGWRHSWRQPSSSGVSSPDLCDSLDSHI